MRLIPLIAAVLALTAAPAAAEPRFTLLAGDGTGYAVEATDQPATFALSDDRGSGVVETRLPDAGGRRVLRVAASARCMPGGARLVRIYGMAAPQVRRVVAETSGGTRFALRIADAPAAWDTDASVIGRLVEIAESRIRLTATRRDGARVSALTISFTQTCAAEGTRALAATLTPPTATLDTTALTARLVLPARPEAASYAVNLVQPGWSAGRSAFRGDPWGSPLGPDGEVRLEGPGTLEGATPALAQVGDVCLRGAARIANTVIVRVPAGEATTVAWPLAVAPEPLWDATRLQTAFRVRRGDFGGTATSNPVAYEGPLGVRFGLKLSKRGTRGKVTGTTHPALRGRRVTVYLLKARPRERGAQLIANDFRPFRTVRTRTDSRGRFGARFEAERNAYRVVAEASDTPVDRIDDRSCPVERDWR